MYIFAGITYEFLGDFAQLILSVDALSSANMRVVGQGRYNTTAGTSGTRLSSSVRTIHGPCSPPSKLTLMRPCCVWYFIVCVFSWLVDQRYSKSYRRLLLISAIQASSRPRVRTVCPWRACSMVTRCPGPVVCRFLSPWLESVLVINRYCFRYASTHHALHLSRGLPMVYMIGKHVSKVKRVTCSGEHICDTARGEGGLLALPS
jgi:hypothetical protein